MAIPTDIKSNLLSAEQRARSSKLSRLIRSPFKYPLLLGFNKVIYPVRKEGVYINAKTFFNQNFKTLLPAGTDIALNGIKTHDSEIRLTKFLVHHLQEKDTFIDVGAHYGYYSLLASVLVGDTGKVYAIEPSTISHRLLKENCASAVNVKTFKSAASDQSGEITFYEYPGPYAEYNTTVKNAYADSTWIHNVPETVNLVNTIVLDDLIRSEQLNKPFIKIDAEGGELSVLKGLRQSMKEKNLTIILEYLFSDNPLSLHHQAVEWLHANQYQTHVIASDGSLKQIDAIDEHLRSSNLNSDNLVFKRT